MKKEIRSTTGEGELGMSRAEQDAEQHVGSNRQ